MKSTGFFLKSHCDYLQYPLQVDMYMNNVVKCRKDFFAYFNALETRGDTTYLKSWFGRLLLVHSQHQVWH